MWVHVQHQLIHQLRFSLLRVACYLRTSFCHIFTAGGTLGSITIKNIVTDYGDVTAHAQPFVIENTDIALGDRPIKRPIQAVSGVKGAGVLYYDKITDNIT